MRFLSIIPAAVIIFAGNPPFAAPPGSSQNEDSSTPALDRMVVTADKRLQSAASVTQKIDVVDSVLLKAVPNSKRNLAEVISLLPGASVSALSRNDANWGTYAGVGPKYSTWMLGGLPIDGFVDPMSLDINAIDRIEIQRGPASVVYPNYLSQDFAGNQSPLAGTVNLIPRKVVEDPKTLLQSSYGTYNTFNGQGFHQDRAGNLSYFAGTNYERSDYTDYGIEKSWLNMQKDPEYEKFKLYGGATLCSGENDRQKVSLFAHTTHHTGDAGRIYRGYDHRYNTVNAGYEIAITDALNLQSNLGVRTYDRSWQESSFGNGVDTLKSLGGVVQKIVPFDITVSWRHFGNSLLLAGADYQGASYYNWSDPLSGHRTYGNKSGALQGGGFVQEEFNVGNLTARGGLRLSYVRNSIELIDGGKPGQDKQSWITPIWSAGVKYTLARKVKVYTNWGNGFMAPGLKSVGGTIRASERGVAGRNGQLPNPDLRPESGIGGDFGADLTLTNGIRAGLRGFTTLLTDAIIDERVSESPSQSRSINAGGTRSCGAEVEFSWTMSSYLDWFVNYTYMNTAIKSDDADQDGNEVPFAPAYTVNAGALLTAPFGLQFAPSMSVVGSYYDATSTKGRKEFTPGFILNASVSQVVAKGTGFAVELFGQFYNITNNDYEMPWQFKDPGFSVDGGVRVKF